MKKTRRLRAICLAIFLLFCFLLSPRNAPAAQNPFAPISGDQLWIMDALVSLHARGVLSRDIAPLQWEPLPTRYEIAGSLARSLAVVDMTKAGKRDVELVKKLTEEFRVELEAFGVKIDQLDRRVAILNFLWPTPPAGSKLISYDRMVDIVGEEVDIFGDEVDLSIYMPFEKENRLRPLNETSELVISSDYPRLDGATSALPIYGAAAEMTCRDPQRPISCTRTARAYLRLIYGETDIFFGLQPSRQQLEAATKENVKLVMTPIARDAFVFFVNRDNPVNSLTVGEIQDIYQKKIVSWDVVGGAPATILPFQRQENSGSQTIMLAEVMRDRPIAPPLVERLRFTMGTALQVADYRNYPSAIGYTFYYYVTEMNPNANIKLLAVDDIAPTSETIRSGAYPFVVNIYAVTRGEPMGNAKKLIDWLRSEQGQRLVENVGYVGLQAIKAD